MAQKLDNNYIKSGHKLDDYCMIAIQLLCDLLQFLAQLLYGQIYRNHSEFNWMFFQQKSHRLFSLGSKIPYQLEDNCYLGRLSHIIMY